MSAGTSSGPVWRPVGLQGLFDELTEERYTNTWWRRGADPARPPLEVQLAVARASASGTFDDSEVSVRRRLRLLDEIAAELPAVAQEDAPVVAAPRARRARA